MAPPSPTLVSNPEVGFHPVRPPEMGGVIPLMGWVRITQSENQPMHNKPNQFQRFQERKRKRIRAKRGFALIITLSLMILLVIIAVGLLTLSSISLRTSSQGSADSIARSNARLAMMLAMGDLQKSLGPDQRVSAPASSVVPSAKRPHLTGAWSSWRWKPGSGGGPTYSEKKNGFKGWLVSTSTPEEAMQFGFSAGGDPIGAAAVSLVGDALNPLKDSRGFPTLVMGEKVKVGSATQPGKFSWAVFDESTKAAVDIGDPAEVRAEGMEIASRTAPDRFRADVLDPKLSSLKTPKNLVSLETATVADGGLNRSEFRRRFHDFATGVTGLLTDTAKGGLKTDLTTLFEAASLPVGAFPAATATSPYEGFSNGDGAPKWAYLRDHYRKYKSVTSSSTGESTYKVNDPRSTDLKINPSGVSPSPDTERLLPAIAKFQMVFSLVSHNAHIGDRVRFLDASGDPRGNSNHAVIHLAYDPVITLYNPYDVTLNLQKIRIRVWDPPVGFRFQKIDNKAGTRVYFRPPAPGKEAEFLSLARFQRTNENNTDARKCFTLVLADGTDEAATNSLKLKPGEVRVFSPRVETNWTWGTEVADGLDEYAPRSFFDWNQESNFGNVDKRTLSGLGKWGVEAVPGWQSTAGLQTDHLSTGGRDASTLYPFEKAAGARIGGFLSMRLTDEVVVEAMPKVTSGSGARHFQVDVLAGIKEGASATKVSGDIHNAGVSEDRLRSYIFNFDGTDISSEISEDPKYPVIERLYRVADVLQKIDEGRRNPKKPGLKKAFAMLEMSARTTKDDMTDSKPWLYNNFVVEGSEQNSKFVGLTHQSYDLRLTPISSFTNFPEGVSVDPDTKRGYYGPSATVADGSSFVNMLHIPLAPAASLGDLIPSNLVSGSLLPRVVHPFGNSRAHPLIPSNGISHVLGSKMLDHSYLLNDGLWDSYYFSSLTSYGGIGGGVITQARSLKEVLTDVLDGSKSAINTRLVPVVAPGDPGETASDLAALADAERSRQLAKHIAVNGSFNVNSTSLDAWCAVLSSLRDREINGIQLSATGAELSKQAYTNRGATPFVRVSKPLAGSSPANNLRWAGFRALTDAEILDLAKRIVEEITLRGAEDSAPSLTLGEFVNRRPGGPADLHSLAGLLQTAIDKSEINQKSHFNSDGTPRDSKTLSAANIADKRKKGVQTAEVLDGYSGEGAPSMLTQGDLMAVLAPIATVRGDTFKIRSYGESTSKDGKSVLARVWCEAVVQRVPEFIDASDAPETAIASLTSTANKSFGRRFHVVSFRWIDEKEL